MILQCVYLWACIINQLMKGTGLQITGIKLSSPAPAKKSSTPLVAAKPKLPHIIKSERKPTAPKKVNTNESKPEQKKQPPKKTGKQLAKQTEAKRQSPQGKEKDMKKEPESPKVQAAMEVKVQEAPPVEYEVVVRYNHYKQKFKCINHVLPFGPTNQKYCFALVFKGNYQPVLRNFKTRQVLEPLSAGRAEEYSWAVQEDQVYEVQIQEDQQQESKHERHAYKAPSQPSCPIKRNPRAEQLTQQMKELDVAQLGSQKHRELLEQRDLEDTLFS